MVAFLAWNVWFAVTAPLGLAPDRTIDFLVSTQSKNVLFFLFILAALKDQKYLHLLVLTTVFGASTTAFFYIKGGMPGWGSPLPMYDVNDLALLLNMSLPFAVYLAMTVKEERARWVLWGFVIAMLISVAGTRSRGGFLTAVAVIGYLLVALRSVNRRVVAGVAVSVVALLFVAPDSYWERIATILNPSEDYNTTSDLGRIAIWKRGMGYLADRPVQGLGPRNFSFAEGTLRPEARLGVAVKASVTHSTPVEVLVETGVVGAMLWLTAIMTALVGLRRHRGRHRRRAGPDSANAALLCDATIASGIAYLVGGLFLSQAYFPYVLVVLAIAFGCGDRSATASRPGAPRRVRPTVRSAPRGRARVPQPTLRRVV